MITWRSPTGFEDPDTKWDDETDAYDDNTGSRAINLDIPPKSWGNDLILTRAAVTCRRVRFYARSSLIDQIDLDIYYDGGWHGLYLGAYGSQQWVEKIIDPAKSITKARVKFYNSDAEITDHARIYEFDFGEVGDPDAPTDLEVEEQTNPERVITGSPHFTAIFNANDTVNAAHYQIEVGSSRLGSDKWDSAKQALSPECGDGERCKLIVYGGSKLSLKTKYWWRLKFWDTDGRASPWSDS